MIKLACDLFCLNYLIPLKPVERYLVLFLSIYACVCADVGMGAEFFNRTEDEW